MNNAAFWDWWEWETCGFWVLKQEINVSMLYLINWALLNLCMKSHRSGFQEKGVFITITQLWGYFSHYNQLPRWFACVLATGPNEHQLNSLCDSQKRKKSLEHYVFKVIHQAHNIISLKRFQENRAFASQPVNKHLSLSQSIIFDCRCSNSSRQPSKQQCSMKWSTYQRHPRVTELLVSSISL